MTYHRIDVTNRFMDSSSVCVKPEHYHIPFNYVVEFWGRGHSGDGCSRKTLTFQRVFFLWFDELPWFKEGNIN